MHRALLLAVMIVVAATPANTLFAQTARAVAESDLITELEIQQRRRLAKRATREEVIEELREEKLKIQQAREHGVEVADVEVDQAYANMAARMRLTSEQMTEQLARSGVDADTVKHRIRADIAAGRSR
jgi:peptidyl-prolyl cis-trans isomerase SurA